MAIHNCKKNLKKCHGLVAFFVLLTCIAGTVLGNEMPLAGHPANGIIVRDEDNIQIVREDLYIRRSKIEVSYVFENHSDKDIVTDVAFPIPPYKYDPSGVITYPIYIDFKLEVNGSPVKYDKIHRGIANGKDVTSILDDLKLAIHVFGFSRTFNNLSETKMQELVDLGIIEKDFEGDASTSERPYSPAWSVETTFHWKQTFPAKSKTSTKITYTPNPSQSSNPDFEKDFINRRKIADPFKADLSELFCLNDELKKWNKARDSKMEAYIVDYILTTANHWKKPIKEFNLIIEADTTPGHNRVSTCFQPTRLKKISDTKYQTTIRDYVPKEEISVFFLWYPHARE